MWFTSSKYKRRWFVIAFNLVMIFLGLQFIDFAYEAEFFSATGFPQHLHVLYAMYLAFIAGLLPNYASSIAQEFLTMDRSSLPQLFEVLVFFLITIGLHVGVIWLAIKL
ncbi:MAG: hypothetical protein ACOCVM_05475 [Desulfovibrionaceae bacterium]